MDCSPLARCTKTSLEGRGWEEEGKRERGRVEGCKEEI